VKVFSKDIHHSDNIVVKDCAKNIIVLRTRRSLIFTFDSLLHSTQKNPSGIIREGFNE